MILADTSAWIEYDRATGSAVHRQLRDLLGGKASLAVTEPIVMEVAAGARDDRRERLLRELLSRPILLGFDSVLDFDGAVDIYRRCRAAGVTPRGLVDCMIASVARRHDATLLAHDADLARIADVMSLRLDAASLRP